MSCYKLRTLSLKFRNLAVGFQAIEFMNSFENLIISVNIRLRISWVCFTSVEGITEANKWTSCVYCPRSMRRFLIMYGVEWVQMCPCSSQERPRDMGQPNYPESHTRRASAQPSFRPRTPLALVCTLCILTRSNYHLFHTQLIKYLHAAKHPDNSTKEQHILVL